MQNFRWLARPERRAAPPATLVRPKRAKTVRHSGTHALWHFFPAPGTPSPIANCPFPIAFFPALRHFFPALGHFFPALHHFRWLARPKRRAAPPATPPAMLVRPKRAKTVSGLITFLSTSFYGPWLLPRHSGTHALMHFGTSSLHFGTHALRRRTFPFTKSAFELQQLCPRPVLQALAVTTATTVRHSGTLALWHFFSHCQLPIPHSPSS
jgi:hypothetical protein